MRFLSANAGSCCQAQRLAPMQARISSKLVFIELSPGRAYSQSFQPQCQANRNADGLKPRFRHMPKLHHGAITKSQMIQETANGAVIALQFTQPWPGPASLL